MFKTTLTYTSFAGTEITDDLRFNLTETEMRDLVRKNPMFDTDFLSFVSQEQDLMKMMDVIQELVIVSYGDMSEDGRYFRKSEDRALDFMQSAAYEAFLSKILDSDDGSAFVDFIMGVFPSRMAAEMKDKLAERKDKLQIVHGQNSTAQ